MLKIRANSWHYKLYSFYCDIRGINTCKPHNLCQYGRRVLLALLIFGGVLLLALMIQIVAHLFAVASLVFHLLSGYYPNRYCPPWSRGCAQRKLHDDDYHFFHYETYSPPKVMGVRLYPWKALLFFVFLAIVAAVPYAISHNLPLLFFVAWVIGGAITIAVLFNAFPKFMRRIRESKTAQLFVAYIAAKKQKICPLIEVVDEPTAKTNTEL